MTANEAIETIKVAIAEVEWDYPMEYSVAFEVAISAVEKQIAKKPLDKTQEYDGEYGLCPCCEQIVADYKEYKRCSECGQALDWSDTE